MKNIDFLKRILVPLVMLCSIPNSCTSPEKEKETFDYPLLQKNEAYRLAGNYEKALELNREYLQIAQKNGYKDGIALCYINIASLSITIGNYDKGLAFLKKAELLLKNSDNKALKARVFQEYGQMSKVTELHKTALEYNTRALYYTRQCSLEDKKKYILSKVFSNRADFLYETNQNDSALIYFHKAKNIENTDLINGLIAKHHLFHTKKMDSVKFYIDRALVLINQQKGASGSQAGQVYRIIGDYYTEEVKDSLALINYQKALTIFIQTRRVYNIPLLYEVMADAYGYLGDKAKEAEFSNKFTRSKEQLSQNQNSTINLLIDQLLIEKETSGQNFKFKTLIFSGIILLVIVFAGILVYKRLKYTKRRIINETADLKDSIIRLQSESESLNSKMTKNNNDLILLAENNDSSFLTRFQEIYPDFIDALLTRNNDLSSTDLWLCAMIRLNFSSKEIASIMSIEHKSVQQKKYRLRKKLNIPSEEDFLVFFQKLENDENSDSKIV